MHRSSQKIFLNRFILQLGRKRTASRQSDNHKILWDFNSHGLTESFERNFEKNVSKNHKLKLGQQCRQSFGLVEFYPHGITETNFEKDLN